MKKLLLEEALSIADQIIYSAQSDQNGLSWSTYSFVDSKSYIKEIKEDLYSGVGGITLFLLHQYKQYPDDLILECCEKALSWIWAHCNKVRSANFAFFTGRGGITYLFLQAFEIMKNPRYLEYALKIAKSSSTMFLSSCGDDLLNGSSGGLLALLHLLNYSDDDWLFYEIQKYTTLLISRAQIGKRGLFWDRSPYQIQGLCGLSHGSSGVSIAFLELFNLFNNEECAWIAKEAIEYENYWLSIYGYWPDLRLGMYEDRDRIEHIAALRNQEWEFFLRGKQMNQWCHGAGGIGLSRIRALDLFGSEEYLDQLKLAYNLVEKEYIEESDISYTLCHGRGSNAFFLMRARNFVRFERQPGLPYQIGKACIDQKRQLGYHRSGYDLKDEDLSLFIGNAGIGLFLLSFNDLSALDILYPIVDKTSSQRSLNVSNKLIREKLIGKYFHRTIAALESDVFGEVDTLESPIRERNIIEGRILQSTFFERIATLFAFEKAIISFDDENRSYVFLQATWEFIRECIINLPLLTVDSRLTLCTNPNVKLILRDGQQILIVRRPIGIQEISLSKFQAVVFQIFERESSISQAIFYLTALNPDLPYSVISQSVLEQIIEAVKEGYIIDRSIRDYVDVRHLSNAFIVKNAK